MKEQLNELHTAFSEFVKLFGNEFRVGDSELFSLFLGGGGGGGIPGLPHPCVYETLTI